MEVAALVTFFLGEGSYGADQIDGDLRVPVFLLGGSNEWIKETFGKDTADFIGGADPNQMADALDSLLIGGPSDRERFTKGIALIEDPHDRMRFKHEYTDRKRGSMNNIDRRAAALADLFRDIPAKTNIPTI